MLLTNKEKVDALNPAAAPAKKRAREEQVKGEKAKKKAKKVSKEVRAGKIAYYKSMVATE